MPNPVAEGRVAQHILDAAANASEHGDEMLADILTGEAHALLDGRIEALIRSAKTERPQAHSVKCIETLRAKVEHTRVIREAREKAETIIEQAWLREGYAVPA